MDSSNENVQVERTQTILGKLLYDLRIENDLSLREAADISDISHSYIRNIEKGYDPRTFKAISPTPEILRRFASAYKVKVQLLLEAAGIIDGELETDTNVKRLREKAFCQRLTFLTDKSEHSITEICRKVGISRTQFEDIERGKTLPSVAEIYNLAALFKVTPDYLAGYVDDEKALHPDMPKLIDMLEFINTSNVQLFGRPMSRIDKERLELALTAVFLDSHQRHIDDK